MSATQSMAEYYENTRVADVLALHAEKVGTALDLTATVSGLVRGVQASEHGYKALGLVRELMDTLSVMQTDLQSQSDEHRARNAR